MSAEARRSCTHSTCAAPHLALLGAGLAGACGSASAVLPYELSPAGSIVGASETHYDGFGDSITEVPDANGDGVSELLVGAPYVGRLAVVSGATQEVMRWIEGAGLPGGFGSAVATASFGEDAEPVWLVGAPATETGEAAAGDSSVEGCVAVLRPSGEILDVLRGHDAGDRFGWALHGGPDFDRDGRSDFAVGAPGRSDGHPEGGYVSVRSGRTGTELMLVRIPGAVGLGQSALLVPDIDRDTHPDLLVSDEQRLFALSGASQEVLWSAGNPGGIVVETEDVDSDGVQDLAVLRHERGSQGNEVCIRCLSAVSGRELWANCWVTSADPGGLSLCRVPDVDGDGAPDLASGDASEGEFSSRLCVIGARSGATLAVRRTSVMWRTSTRVAGLFGCDSAVVAIQVENLSLGGEPVGTVELFSVRR